MIMMCFVFAAMNAGDKRENKTSNVFQGEISMQPFYVVLRLSQIAYAIRIVDTEIEEIVL